MAQDTEDFSPDALATTGVDIMNQERLIGKLVSLLEWDEETVKHARTFTINTSMFRLGLTPQAEVRLQIDECIAHTPEGNFGGIAECRYWYENQGL